jgi:hypothetical protein
MSIPVATIVADVVELINASTPSASYGTTGSPYSEKYKPQEFTDAVLYADIAAARSILNNPKDGRRAGFLTNSAVGHTLFIPTHVGPIDDVWFDITGGEYAGLRGVEPWPVSKLNELENENRNPQANPFIEPHVIIQGDAVFHNAAGLVFGGASAASLYVRYPVLTFNISATNILSPDEFARAIACAAASFLFGKDGQRIGAVSIYWQMYRAEMAMLNVQVPNQIEVPPEMAMAA